MSLIKNGISYTLFNVLNRAIPFSLLPILTEYLSPAEYGLITLYFTLVAIIAPFVGLNIETSIIKNYYVLNKISFSNYLINGFYIILCTTILSTLFLIIASNFIESYSSIPTVLILTLPSILFFQCITAVLLGIYRLQSSPYRYGFFQNSITLVNIAVSLAAILLFNLGWIGRVTGYIAATAIFGLLASLILYKKFKFWGKFQIKYIKSALGFGLPLLPHELMLIIVSSSDKLFLAKFDNMAELGLYSIVFQLGSIVSIIIISFNSAFMPWLFENLKMNNFEVNKKIVKRIYIISGAILVLSAFYAFLSPYLFSIVLSKKYNGAYYFLMPISIGFAFQGISQLFSNFVYYTQKTYLISFVTIVVGIVTITSNYLLINRFGLYGAAYSFLIASIVMASFNFLAAIKSIEMPWLIFRKL